jgi:hypothetical protein
LEDWQTALHEAFDISRLGTPLGGEPK